MNRAPKFAMNFPSRASTSRRGFSLIELAIAMGVIGAILSGIWIAAAKTSQANRINSTVRAASTIIEQYRALYSTYGVPASSPWYDMTCQGMAAGFFPQDMVRQNVPCVAGNTATYPQHPWGGYIQINRNSVSQQLTIWYYYVPKDICIKLMAALSTLPDLQREGVNTLGGVNANARWFPPLGTDQPFTITDLDTLCLPDNSNYLAVNFKVR